MHLVELVGMLTTVLGLWLIATRRVLGWPLSLSASGLYFFIFAKTQLFADAALQIMFVVLCILGWIQWSHHKRENSAFVVRSMGLSSFLRQILAALGVSLIVGLLLKKASHDPAPFLDATLSVFSVLAQIWTAYRYRLSWIIWAIVDCVYIGLYLSRDLWVTSLLYAGLVVLALWGWKQWGEINAKPH